MRISDSSCPEMRSHVSRLSREEAELEGLRARSKTHAAGASPGVGAAAAAALVGGLPGATGAQLTKVQETRRTAGEAGELARRHDVSDGGGRLPVRPPQIKGAPGAKGSFFCSTFRICRGQRRRLLRDVNGASRALNLMHGEESRPEARPPFLVASEDENRYLLHEDVQQRIILAALCWVDADSAVDENVGLAKLHRPCARCLVQRRLQRVLAGKLSRFSCACTVGDRDAACEGKALSREVSVTDAVAVGGSRCKSEVEGEPGCHRRSCAARGHTLALSFRRSRLGSQHLRLDPLACSAFSKRTEDDLRLIEGRCFCWRRSVAL